MRKFRVSHHSNHQTRESLSSRRFQPTFSLQSLPSLDSQERTKVSLFLENQKEKMMHRLQNSYVSKLNPNFQNSPLSSIPESLKQFVNQLLPTDIKKVILLAGEQNDYFPTKNCPQLRKVQSQDHILSYPKPSKRQSLSSILSGREQVNNLISWFNYMKKHHLKDLQTENSQQILDKMDTWKSIITVGLKQVIRQISFQCSDRAMILDQHLKSYFQIWSKYQIIFKSKIKEEKEKGKRDLNSLKYQHSKINATFQSKMNKLVSDNIKLTQQVRELENKVQQLKYSLNQKEEFCQKLLSTPIQSEQNFQIILAHYYNQVKIKQKQLQDLETKIQQAQRSRRTIPKLSIKCSEFQLIKPFQQVTKTVPSQNSVQNKIFSQQVQSPIKLFYSKLLKRKLKTKDLIRKVSIGQILKSINIIYQKAVTKINQARKPLQMFSVLYEHYTSKGKPSLGESKLQTFIGSCVKFSHVLRVEVFLKICNLGFIINKPSYSKHSSVFYLSLLSFILNQQIGTSEYLKPSLQVQYVSQKKVSRCLQRLTKDVFSQNQIQDLWQIIQSKTVVKEETKLVQVQFFLDLASTQYEIIQQSIVTNVNSLHKLVTFREQRLYFALQELQFLIQSIVPQKNSFFFTNNYPTPLLSKSLDHHFGSKVIYLDKLVNFSVEHIIFKNSHLLDFLRDLSSFTREQAKSYLNEDIGLVSADDSEIYKKLQSLCQHLDEFETVPALVWYHVLKERFFP